MNLIRRLVKGSPLTAVEHDANLNAIQDAIERERNGISASFTGNTSGVTVTAGDFAPLPSPWDLVAFPEGFEVQGDAIVCTDPDKRRYLVIATVYLDDGANVTAMARFAVNGTPCMQCIAKVTIPAAERPAGQSLVARLELEDGDEVRIIGTRVESGGSLVLEDSSISIVEA